MRPVRILLAVLALLAVGVAGWALGARGDDPQPSAGPATTAAPPQGDVSAVPNDPTAKDQTGPEGGTPSGDPSGGTRPAAKPRVVGFGSEPVLPDEGGFWRLPAGAGTLTLVTDAPNATRVEFLLTPTGTGAGDLAVRIGQDTDGRDGWLVNWRYGDEPLLAHLTVRATGPGGSAERSVGVIHPDPELP